MTALPARERTGAGQVVDMAIIEPILTVLGPQPTWYDQLGHVQPRTGNRSANNAPRNTYRTADGTWVAVSTSAQSIAERVMRLVGRPELIDEPWFATGAGRAAHADVLDAAVGDWIARARRDEVLAAFEKAEAAVAPIYDVRDVMTDPQYQALDTVTTVDDPELGPLRMQNVLFRLSATPGAIRWAGRPHGADTDGGADRAGPDPAGRERAARGGRRDRPHPADLAVRPRRPARAWWPRRWRRAPTWWWSTWRTRSPRTARRTPARPPPNCSPSPQPVPVHVRVNALDGPLAGADLRALAALPGCPACGCPR